MKSRALVLFAALLMASAHGAEPSSAAQEHPVIKVLAIRSGKVVAVAWSVQSDLCTIQITFPGVPNGRSQPRHARTQVWLLKSDGTAVSQKDKPITPSIGMAGYDTDSIIYSFPPSTRTETIAVVVSIDDQLFVERLTPEPK